MSSASSSAAAPYRLPARQLGGFGQLGDFLVPSLQHLLRRLAFAEHVLIEPEQLGRIYSDQIVVLTHDLALGDVLVVFSLHERVKADLDILERRESRIFRVLDADNVRLAPEVQKFLRFFDVFGVFGDEPAGYSADGQVGIIHARRGENAVVAQLLSRFDKVSKHGHGRFPRIHRRPQTVESDGEMIFVHVAFLEQLHDLSQSLFEARNVRMLELVGVDLVHDVGVLDDFRERGQSPDLRDPAVLVPQVERRNAVRLQRLADLQQLLERSWHAQVEICKYFLVIDDAQRGAGSGERQIVNLASDFENVGINETGDPRFAGQIDEIVSRVVSSRHIGDVMSDDIRQILRRDARSEQRIVLASVDRLQIEGHMRIALCVFLSNRFIKFVVASDHDRKRHFLRRRLLAGRRRFGCGLRAAGRRFCLIPRSACREHNQDEAR